MRRHSLWFAAISLVALGILAGPQPARADRIDFKNGTSLDGVIIKKVEAGKVTVEANRETREFSILEISSMVFDTPHLPAGGSRLPLEHFLANMEAQEMVGHIEAVEKAAADARMILGEIKKEWAGRKTIAPQEAPAWEAAKERMRRALSRYQEVIGDFYFHAAGKIENYQRLTKEGNELYVGVRGVFNTGSPLIPTDIERLPLKKYVPSNWYDTIFYSGYEAGFYDGYYGARPREVIAPQ